MGHNFVGWDKKGREVIKARQCIISNVRMSYFDHGKNETWGTLSPQKQSDYMTQNEVIAWEKMGLSGWARTTRVTERDDFAGQDVKKKVLDTRHEVNGLNEAQEVVMTKEEEMRWWENMKQDMRGRNETLRRRRQTQDKIKRKPEQNVGDDNLTSLQKHRKAQSLTCPRLPQGTPCHKPPQNIPALATTTFSTAQKIKLSLISSWMAFPNT